MRVLQLMAGRGNGGAETYCADMIGALHEIGINQLAVLHPLQGRVGELRDRGVQVETRALRWPFTWLRRRAVADLIDDYAPDLVHCWMRRAGEILPVVTVPAIGWFGGYYRPEKFRHCSHFVGVTPDIVAHQRAHGVPEARSFFIPTFPTLDDGVAVDRALLTTPEDAPVLLALSRLHPKKGLDTLLRALVDLPGVYLWLAGDGPLQAELEALAAQLGVGARVRFLGWRNDRGALLRAADICVLPSRYEPFGTVMLEAWAAGVPLVAAAAAGPAAFVRDRENGMMVPPDDVTALSGALRAVLADVDLRARLVAGGQACYQAQFTRDAVRRQLVTLYEQLIAGGS